MPSNGGRNFAEYIIARRRRILLGSAIAVVVAAFTVIGAIGYRIGSKPSTPIRSAGSVLDGTYRLDYDFAKRTQNGAPNPGPNVENTSWWAFRSSCTSSGCFAAGTALDSPAHQVARTPALSTVLHFVNGHWEVAPLRLQGPQQHCFGADGQIAAGMDTEIMTWSLTPQADGTFGGSQTDTVLTAECGLQGSVIQVPFVAKRVGDVPPGVAVTDPVTITATNPATSTPEPIVGGQVLDGTYRLDEDVADQTRNGAPTTGSARQETEDWAFRSLCTTTGCFATASQLAENSDQQATGVAVVFHFADGQWQNVPFLQPPTPCPGNGRAANSNMKSWSLEPQPDGTLRGVETVIGLTNECGNQGAVWRAPIVVTRVGDVAPSVIVADPALFTDTELFEPPRAVAAMLHNAGG